MLFNPFFLFIIGLFIGSFLGVVSDRVPKGKSIVLPPSHCDFCGKTLKWYDNIPLLSFILLSGKCRHCHKSLSFLYPAIELITALLFVSTYSFLGSSFIINPSSLITLLFYLFIASSLIAIFFSDLKFEIIPIAILYPAIVLTIVFLFFNHSSLILNLYSGVGSALFFLLLFAITKGRGMGLGDAQLAFFMGLFLGFPNVLIALYVAFLTGGIVSFILIIWRKKKLRGSTIPFGPFLVFGTLFALFFGTQLIQKFLPGLF